VDHYGVAVTKVVRGLHLSLILLALEAAPPNIGGHVSTVAHFNWAAFLVRKAHEKAFGVAAADAHLLHPKHDR